MRQSLESLETINRALKIDAENYKTLGKDLTEMQHRIQAAQPFAAGPGGVIPPRQPLTSLEAEDFRKLVQIHEKMEGTWEELHDTVKELGWI